MALIKATCPSCGQVDLTAEDIELRIDPLEETGTYAFRCPACIRRVDKPADRRIVRLLLAGGVAPQPHEIEASGEPFTYDDLLDFHFELQNDAAIEAFLGTNTG